MNKYKILTREYNLYEKIMNIANQMELRINETISIRIGESAIQVFNKLNNKYVWLFLEDTKEKIENKIKTIL